MQGGHGYYGGGNSPPQGYGYGYGGGGAYGYDAGAYGGAGGGYYSTGGYPSSAPAPYVDSLAAQRAHEFPAPLNGLEFQPSETCPKNYVIFDQTCTKSRVMFHPSLANKLGGSSGGHGHEYDHYDYYGGGDPYGAAYGGDVGGKGAYRDNKDHDDDSCSVRQKEDTEEIDALLSSEEDDVVSTGRTPGYRDDDGSSPDSTCSSSYGSGKPRPKKERMKKMMRTLKGIIPGGSQMDTPAVLDEAVRYLKSLKVEAKKLGVRGGSDSS